MRVMILHSFFFFLFNSTELSRKHTSGWSNVQGKDSFNHSVSWMFVFMANHHSHLYFNFIYFLGRECALRQISRLTDVYASRVVVGKSSQLNADMVFSDLDL